MIEPQSIPTRVSASEDPERDLEALLEFLKGLPESTERNYAILNAMAVLESISQ